MSDLFSSMLTGPQWLVLCLIPPAIVALYFLKLRRRPLEVPSTFLWQRTIEDMRVNSLWQRLRQNLLLFLQLLLIALLMLACLRPSWQSRTPLKNRLIFLVDTSASMTATDIPPSRLESARQKIDDLIEQMAPGDVAMLISFSDRAIVEQPFTTNKGLLRSRLQAIEPTEKASDISEALRVAAGLANPGRSGDVSAGDVAAAEAMPADVFILSDGGFRNVPEFSWGNLNPIYVPIGNPQALNLAIGAFRTEVSLARPERMEAFIEVENFSTADVAAELTLSLNDALLDATELEIKAGETAGTSFAFDKIESGILKAALTKPDDLAADNVAFAAINRGRRARILLVSDSNDALELALGTESARKLAESSRTDVANLASGEFESSTSEGEYDLIIFDRCQPKTMPKSNTLFIGIIPPGDQWSIGKAVAGPTIIDVEAAHPLMKYLSFGDVRIATGSTIEGPLGSHILLDSDAGPLLAIAPREGFEDAVLGFPLEDVDENGQVRPNTDWPIRPSFPLFCKNLIEYLAAGGTSDQILALPGEAVALRVDGGGTSVTVVNPTGESQEVPRDRNNTYVFADTDMIGVYEVIAGGNEVSQRFSVNLFDHIESRIAPQPSFETAWNRVAAQTGFETTRREAWRWIVALAIVVLMVEWYIYNRRVYL